MFSFSSLLSIFLMCAPVLANSDNSGKPSVAVSKTDENIRKDSTNEKNIENRKNLECPGVSVAVDITKPVKTSDTLENDEVSNQIVTDAQNGILCNRKAESCFDSDQSKCGKKLVTNCGNGNEGEKQKFEIEQKGESTSDVKSKLKDKTSSKAKPSAKLKIRSKPKKNLTKPNPNKANKSIKNAPDSNKKSTDEATKISFVGNEQVNVVLSNRDINRILVEGDRIEAINGPAGLYVAKNDSSGSAYLSVRGKDRVTIFVSTLKGHNFSLLITPKSVFGKTIVLNPTSPYFLTLPGSFEEVGSYQKMLVDLMKNMINEELSDEYSRSDLRGKAKSEAKSGFNRARDNQNKKGELKKFDFYGLADIELVAFYSGTHLFGSVSEIKNKTRQKIILKPEYFYRKGIRAIALSQQELDPGATGVLYQVTSLYEHHG